jgi:hypothetical protein
MLANQGFRHAEPWRAAGWQDLSTDQPMMTTNDNILGMDSKMRRIVTLADYDETEPSLRSILSTSADVMLPVTADLEQYKNAA